jgi:hypothetical protein
MLNCRDFNLFYYKENLGNIYIYIYIKKKNIYIVVDDEGFGALTFILNQFFPALAAAARSVCVTAQSV